MLTLVRIIASTHGQCWSLRWIWAGVIPIPYTLCSIPLHLQALLDFAVEFPTILTPLITERDLYMVARLHSLTLDKQTVQP